MEVDVEYDPETDTYRAVHDFSAGVSLSTTIVLAIEEAKTGEFPPGALYDVVDPDALDAIFRPRSDVAPYRRGRVEFYVSGCAVSVRSDGVVVVDPQE